METSRHRLVFYSVCKNAAFYTGSTSREGRKYRFNLQVSVNYVHFIEKKLTAVTEDLKQNSTCGEKNQNLKETKADVRCGRCQLLLKGLWQQVKVFLRSQRATGHLSVVF